MPLMTLSWRTMSFVYTDVRTLPNIRNCNTIKKPCWGWGVVESEPAKFKTHRDGKDIFTVRVWLNLGSDSKGEMQHIRVNMYGVYAEGCQYLEVGDPVHFEGTLRFDPQLSGIKKTRYFIIDAEMVIPPYSADGREFCARKRHLQELENAEMLRKCTDHVTGEFVPGLDKLEQHLKEERDGGLQKS